MSSDSNSKPILYSYWRSSCSWRVRVALAHKGIDYEYRAVNLVKNGGEQHSESYKAMNAGGKVPTLVLPNGVCLTQSLAICEYLEELKPSGLLPKSLEERAMVRAMCLQIVADTQPLQNLSVLQKVGEKLGEEEKQLWAKNAIAQGLRAFLKMVEQSPKQGKYCFGDEITLADLCLVPQLYNARRYGVAGVEKGGEFGRLVEIDERLAEVDAFKKGHPDVQPDKQ